MPIDLRRPNPEDVPELGRICYEAFRDIAESHGFPTDFESPEFAAGIAGLLLSQERVYATAAYDGDRPRGSSFVSMWGDVGAIGPVSVDVRAQGEGIGKQLMQDVIAHARGQGHEGMRLVQDAFNMRSLALYASLGFDTKEPLALMALATGSLDPAFRPATTGDVDGMDELCKSVYGVSRKGEIALFLQLGFPAFVLDSGRIRGYLFGGIMGHGVAETEDGMLALLAGVGASAPGTQNLVPIRNGSLYRRALAANHRNVKVMNLMALGAYEEPQGVYAPSVMF
ncbi:MAG: GNAT family N-acetyltransferase [Chloroflexi bacterium]|nr:GNAT family N-acetyltransferase [Chloroflexota bacterium]